jgi:xanthine/CO dehydrogenase XdhC/CoxF family maturation factor
VIAMQLVCSPDEVALAILGEIVAVRRGKRS